jgi:hypothetical protein
MGQPFSSSWRRARPRITGYDASGNPIYARYPESLPGE